MHIHNNHQLSSVFGLSSASTDVLVEEAMSRRVSRTSGNDVSLSEQAKRLDESESVYTLSTGKGDKDVDLDTYFEPKPATEASILDLDGLLLPNEQNVKALQDHLSKAFPDLLSKYNIPEAPESIQYDAEGQMVLPADYPYAEQLKQALKEEPGIAKELSTVNALASHLAALKELEPYHQEMDVASSQAEIDAIIDKYSHLLTDNRNYPSVELSFTRDGQVTVQSDQKALV